MGLPNGKLITHRNQVYRKYEVAEGINYFVNTRTQTKWYCTDKCRIILVDNEGKFFVANYKKNKKEFITDELVIQQILGDNNYKGGGASQFHANAMKYYRNLHPNWFAGWSGYVFDKIFKNTAAMDQSKTNSRAGNNHFNSSRISNINTDQSKGVVGTFMKNGKAGALYNIRKPAKTWTHTGVSDIYYQSIPFLFFDCKNSYLQGSQEVVGSPVNWQCKDIGGVTLSGTGTVTRAKGKYSAPNIDRPNIQLKVARLGDTVFPFNFADYIPGKDHKPYGLNLASGSHSYFYGTTENGKPKATFVVQNVTATLPWKSSYRGKGLSDHWSGQLIIKVGDTPDEVCVVGVLPGMVRTSDRIKAGYHPCELVHNKSPRSRAAYIKATNAGYQSIRERTLALVQNPPSCNSIQKEALRSQAMAYPPISPPSSPLKGDKYYDPHYWCPPSYVYGNPRGTQPSLRHYR